MTDPPAADDTFLTERQAEVLALRHEGLTQREIADRLGTSVANVSSVEAAARRNVSTARRTVRLAEVIEAADRFGVAAGTDLRELVDRVYDRADAADVRIAHSEPELSAHLQALLGDALDGRRLVVGIEVGITADGVVDVIETAGGG